MNGITQRKPDGNSPDMKQPDPHMQEMREMHLHTLWVHFTVILLGCWLISSPFVLGYTDPGNFGPRVAEITAERGLPSMELRAQLMMWSDIASGCLMIIFGGLSLFYRHRWAQWGTCLVGVWLLMAPLFFWAPDVASTNNDLIVGALAITFSVLVPMMPGMSMDGMKQKEDIPPGWDYSPSSWSQRLPIIALAFFSFFLARHMMAYQMGHISYVWDPFFGDGTRKIITSDISKAWPVADAGLGAISYLLEALSGAMGDRRRWRTMPWMVGMMGVLVVPLGAISIYFIMIQPVLIGTWCTLCLVTAVAMVIMLPYTFDEIVAMLQFMAGAKKEGRSLWSAFWHGGPIGGATRDYSPAMQIKREDFTAIRKEAAALPQGILISAAIGIWLMFTRIIFGTEGAMANSDHIVGALVFTISVSAIAEVARPLRALNMLLGTWLLAAPWLLEGAGLIASLASVMVGGLLIVLSIPRGPIRKSYNGWDRYLVW
jgi:hypothetical protein